MSHTTASENNQPNPYAPPTDPAGRRGPPEGSEQDRRPTRLPQILGIVSMAMAGLTLGSSALSGAIGYGANASSLFRDLTTKSLPTKLRETYVRHYRILAPVAIGQAVSYGVLALVLFVVGLGQRRYRRWARFATLAWCGLALCMLVVSVYITLTIVVPNNQYLRQQTFEQLPSGSMMSALQSLTGVLQGQSFTVGIQIISHLPYPLILLFAFTRPRVVRAMNS